MATEKPKEPPKLKPKTVPGRITLLKAIPYKGSMVYIRQIDQELFEYLVVFGGQIYSSYLIITPRPGRKVLSGSEVRQSAALVFTGAVTTVDSLLDKVSKQTKKEEKNYA